MVNIFDVSKKAKVSIATVSRVINKKDKVSLKTRKKVLKVIKELNYDINIVAKSLVTKKTNIIGVLVPDITWHICAYLLRGIEDAALENNFNIIVGNTDKNPVKFSNYLSNFTSRSVDGFIISCTETIRKNYKLIDSINKPYVFISDYISSIESSYVVADNLLGGYLVGEHLAKLNHKKIALILGPKENSSTIERREGFFKALKEYDLVFNKKFEFFGDFSAESGYEAMKKIDLLSEKPTAVFAFNDIMAIGAIKYLNSKKILIPEQYALVGFDNLNYSFLIKPSLTTIILPKYILGYKAASVLIKNINANENIIEKIKLTPKLIIRESTVKNAQSEWELQSIL